MGDGELVRISTDTSVLLNYLYSTVIPNTVGGDPVFESDQGCRRYFDEEFVYLVVGEVAKGEFESAAHRRGDIYRDIALYLEEERRDIAYYEPSERNVHLAGHDGSHIQNVQIELTTEPLQRQATIARECWEARDVSRDSLLHEELDEVMDPTEDEERLDRKFSRELDIGDDTSILTDCVYIALRDDVPMLAAKDSDITDSSTRSVVSDILEETFDGAVDLLVVDVTKTTPEDLQ